MSSTNASEVAPPGTVAAVTVVAPAAPVAVAQPVAPASSVTLSEASFLQLLKAAGVRVEGEAKTDVEDIASPSKLIAAVEAIPSEFAKGIKYVNWPLVIVGSIAIIALVMHFPRIVAAIF